MTPIYLPELKSLSIKDYTLYPHGNGLDFNHEFVNGINLIVGGNGMGKTTLVNLIKYSIIGHYKKRYDYTRTRKDKGYFKRTPLPWNYFSKREDAAIEVNSSPTVSVEFYLNKNLIFVERELDDIKVTSLKINNQIIVGEVINQYNFDQQFSDYHRTEDDEKQELVSKLNTTLQYKYEKAVEKYSGIPFDDLIFFVNRVLFFGEDHSTILWNEDASENVQDELFNKYFNDRELNNKREEAQRQSKYFNTLARHRSEAIKEIQGVITRIKGEEINSSFDDLRESKSLLSDEIVGIDSKIDSLQKKRTQLDKDLKQLSNQVNLKSQEASQIEQEIAKEESVLINHEWVNLHHNYSAFVKSIESNEICPMCSQELAKEFVMRSSSMTNNCILCAQEIYRMDSSNQESSKIQSQKKKSENLYKIINQLQGEIYSYEEQLDILDSEFNSLKNSKREIQSELRKIEYQLMKDDDDQKNESTLKAIYDELDKLETLKNEYNRKSNEQKAIAQQISDQIESVILENVQKFSSQFSVYAQMFLGLECSLTYKASRFYPVINNSIRESKEELSESQRFFVDHSFRMSILSFFYRNPTFYIVETPDSSLDISYEENAANVFHKFLENPFALILTTNLNNSEFIKHLTQSKYPVSIINLLEISHQSPIQLNNENLKKIYTSLSKGIK